ncbi:MAG: hypothetical protein J6T45_05615 [Fibrobacterales bacterium]|nr:hypothetical protein [Fibrobacterales bacterium]
MHHRVLFLLLSAAALCFADDVAAPADSASAPAQETATASVGQDTLSGAGTEAVADAPITADEPDSVAIYRELIKQENAQANYKSSQTGIVVGAGLAIGGGIWFATVWDRHQALKREVAEHKRTKSAAQNLGDVFGEIAFSAGAAAASVVDVMEGYLSLGVGLAGAAIFGFSVKAYNSRKVHADKRDEYQGSLERLQRRQEEEERSSAQVLFFPTVDVANSGAGLNLAILF